MDCQPLDLSPFVCFAIEAGGHYTLYNKGSEEVIMFNTDPGLPYIQPMAAHPPATLFKIKGAVNFVEYVEKLADEWIKYIGD